VIHLAAGLKGSAADLFLNSVVCSKNLLEAIAASGRKVKVVHVSSFGVYASAAMRPGEILTEESPLEPEPVRRDLYSYSKLRQEQLFHEYSRRHGIPLVVVRPGVIYGPRGSLLSVRVGLTLGPIFVFLGGRNRLPLTYVDNCADAIIAAAGSEAAVGQTFNIHDDDLPTCAEYLRRYRREVGRLRVVRIPYRATLLLSRLIERYHIRSKGQLPAILTPYKARANWKSMRFDNRKIKSLGWRPLISTDEGLRTTFAGFREQDSNGAAGRA
jgi:nucleoside-diphosphate-sugar epimerase